MWRTKGRKGAEVRGTLASWVIWGVVAALGIVGAIGALERGADVLEFLAQPEALRSEPPSLDRRHMERFGGMLQVGPESAEFRDLERALARFNSKYRTQWLAALLHVFPGALVLTFGLLQFSNRIRTRHPKVHRISGRILLIAVAAASLSGIYLGIFEPYGDVFESSAAALFGGFMLFAGVRGFLAIRRRDVPRHREWMIRMFATGIAIAVMRVMSAASILVMGMGAELLNPRAPGVLLWTGWLVTLACAELWIRRTRGTLRAASPSIRSAPAL